MITSHSNQNYRGSVYPGEYTPLLDTAELIEDLRRPHEQLTAQPLINISEQPDCFKIEVTIPGFKRENFFVNIENNVLSIVAMHNTYISGEEWKFKQHEPNRESFDHHIILPENIDPEFVSAEYLAGVLTIYLLKTIYKSKNTLTQVIVY